MSFPHPFGSATALVCKECKTGVELSAQYACPECFGPLEVAYEFKEVTKAEIVQGPFNMWRYRSLLPVNDSVLGGSTLQPGLTRLLSADNLASKLDLKSLFIKDDSTNPTGSFKDRPVACALHAFSAFGFQVFACPSTGNLANAVAAAAAKAKVPSVVLVPHSLEAAKKTMSAVYTPGLLSVNGSYDDVNKLACELAAEYPTWGFVNVNLRPFYAEGSKTIGYEVAEQLGWKLPDQLVLPVASGSLFTKVYKAFKELIALGFVEEKPVKFFGVQPTGCSPVATAFAVGQDIVPVKPSTVAKSLAIGSPADGQGVLDIVSQTQGAVVAVSDDEIRHAILQVARSEGVLAETAGGTAFAGLKKLTELGLLDPDAQTVVVNTATGLKTLDVPLGLLEEEAVIDPRLASFEQLVLH